MHIRLPNRCRMWRGMILLRPMQKTGQTIWQQTIFLNMPKIFGKERICTCPAPLCLRSPALRQRNYSTEKSTIMISASLDSLWKQGISLRYSFIIFFNATDSLFVIHVEVTRFYPHSPRLINDKNFSFLFNSSSIWTILNLNFLFPFPPHITQNQNRGAFSQMSHLKIRTSGKGLASIFHPSSQIRKSIFYVLLICLKTSKNHNNNTRLHHI